MSETTTEENKPKIDLNNPLIKLLQTEDEFQDNQLKELSDYLSEALGSDKLDQITSEVTEELGENMESATRLEKRTKLLDEIKKIADVS